METEAVFICSLGENLKQNCSEIKWLTASTEVIEFKNLPEDERYALPLKAKLSPHFFKTVCAHHRAFFKSDKYYNKKNNYCCDPFDSHKRGSKGKIFILNFVVLIKRINIWFYYIAGTTTITVSFSKESSSISPPLVPGDTLCYKCLKLVKDANEDKPDSNDPG